MKKLERMLSRDRLAAYGHDKAGDDVVVARYLWNVAVSESLYAPIHLLEVGLRNAIDCSMTTATGSATWYDIATLTPWGRGCVTNAKSNIERSGKLVQPGRVIAELPFGFWTSMFESHFESPDAHFLPKGIKSTFPFMPKSLHNRKRIKADLDRIRILRNRIFHHERVVHWQDLSQQHSLILSFLDWLDPALCSLADVVDRFKDTHSAGIQPYLDLIAAKKRCGG